MSHLTRRASNSFLCISWIFIWSAHNQDFLSKKNESGQTELRHTVCVLCLEILSQVILRHIVPGHIESRQSESGNIQILHDSRASVWRYIFFNGQTYNQRKITQQYMYINYQSTESTDKRRQILQPLIHGFIKKTLDHSQRQRLLNTAAKT